MVNTKVTLSGITLDNPVIPASGTFGFGYEFADIAEIKNRAFPAAMGAALRALEEEGRF